MPNLDVPTIVFAVVAIFVIFKLRQVLGTRTGNEPRPPMSPPAPPQTNNVIPLSAALRTGAATPPPPPAERWKGFAEANTPLAAGLDAIAAREPFDPAHFLTGARGAYEMIVGAFAAGDLVALRGLLGPDVYANFARAIEARKAAGQTMATTIVSIDSAKLADAQVSGSAATLAVRFAAKLASATLDRNGATVDGSTTEVVDHLDIWTFARTLGARDPNWLLTATETVH